MIVRYWLSSFYTYTAHLKYTAFAVRCGRSSFGDTWSSSATRRSTLHIFTVHINNLRPEGPSRHDVSLFSVVELVDDLLGGRDLGIRFGNGRFGHLDGLGGGEGLDDVD